jgi:hypothetical protein
VLPFERFSKFRRKGNDAETDFRRAAPAAASRQVEHASNEYKWKQIKVFRERSNRRTAQMHTITLLLGGARELSVSAWLKLSFGTELDLHSN